MNDEELDTITDYIQYAPDLDCYVSAAHTTAKRMGFWDAERNDGELIALMHSELSEALEALRHGDPPDQHCPEFKSTEIEMADVMIRIFDFCGARGIRLEEAIKTKMLYNLTRPIRHGKAF